VSPAPSDADRPIALIVEDDQDIREALAAVVEHAGFEPASATHGLDALRYLERCERLPSVVLLDLMMPVMDGWEFLARRDDRTRSIPVLVLSAVRDTHLPDSVKQLKKPVSVDSLLAALRPWWR
jgi:DNA-binding response OmpR family regulator